MKLTFLGTGAADWRIENFSLGSFFRRNSSALVDSSLLIDPGPHVFHFEETVCPGITSGIRNIIVTHTHPDHFNIDTVMRLCKGTDVVLWGDDACMRKLRAAAGEDADKVHFIRTDVGQTYDIGGYSVTPLRANHITPDRAETARVYIIRDGERVLFYGCDSSSITCEAWSVLKREPVNTMVLELTCGALATDDKRLFEHTDMATLTRMLAVFAKYKYFAPDVKYYVSHMARTLHTDHDTLAKDLEGLGVVPAQDGMTITI